MAVVVCWDTIANLQKWPDFRILKARYFNRYTVAEVNLNDEFILHGFPSIKAC